MPPRIAIAAVFAVAVAALAVGSGIPAAAQDGLLQPLDGRRPLTYFIAEGSPASGYRAADRQLAAWALEAWSRTAAGPLSFRPAKEADARIRVYWVEAGNGQYGEMRATEVGGRRGAAVYIRPDTDALGPDIAASARRDPLFRDTVVYLTCLHELGHALGLSHTSDYQDIMFFFGYGGDIPRFFGRYRDQLTTRADIARVSGASANDIARLRALYATRP
jgi:hypothetical protein